MPPLRDRPEDIPALANYFVGLINQKYNMNKSIDARLLDQLITYKWPGNVRELRNAIERAVVTSIDEVITSIIIGGNNPNDTSDGVILNIEGIGEKQVDFKEAVQLYEKKLLERYINIYKTSRKVARALGITQSMVVRKAAFYEIPLNKE